MISEADRYLEIADLLLVTLDVNGRITMVNKKACDILGYTRKELLGLAWKDYFLPDKISSNISDHLTQMMKSGSSGTDYNENNIVSRDGTCRMIGWHNSVFKDRDGNVTGIICAGTDITEKYEYEKKLKDYSDRLTLATESAGIGTWDADLSTGKVVWDRKMCEIFGLAYGIDIPDIDTWIKFVHPDDLNSANLELQKALSGETARYKNQFRIIRNDGTIRLIEASASVHFDKDGNPLRITGVNWDVTEQQNLIDENIRLQKQFYQAQKMESIGQLAGGIAHDFNNLLVPILGYAELGMSMASGNNDIHDCFTEIEKAGTRAADLTRQILAFSRRQLLEIKPVNLNSIITDFERILKLIVGDDIDLVIETDNLLKPISGDRSQIEQIMLNLTINARDAVVENGTVTIRTGNMVLEKPKPINKIDIPKGEYSTIEVSDNGKGIDPSIIDYIFEPFFTTKPRERGTGLGLSTVFGIVKQHSGYITVDSILDEGTTFLVYFPVITRLTETDSASSSKRNDTIQPNTGNKTILVVEDDESVRNLICRTLINADYRVIEAENSERAILKDIEWNEPLDLLLTDITLPGMDGYSLARKLKEKRKALKTVFTSGYTDHPYGRKNNFADEFFIKKPFIPKDLLNLIYTALK